MVLPYAVAAATALVVAGVEQYNRLAARFTLRNLAWAWWTLRLGLEVGVALLAVLILRSTKTKASREWWSWITAGAAGPAILRLRFLDLGKGDEAHPLGPALAYEPLRQLLETQIDRRSAERQTWWINRKLLPRLERHDVDPALLASYVIDYLNGLPAAATLNRAQEIEYIKSVLDGTQSRQTKREALARHAAFTLGAFRLLNQFLRAARAPGRVGGLGDRT